MHLFVMQNANSNINYQSILDLSRKNWLTRKDVIKQTGISNKLLSTLIRSNIIPKPVIRMSEISRKGSRKNGYFPKTTVERIKMVKRLQQNGHPMEVIAAKFIKKAGIDTINGKNGKNFMNSGILLNIPVADEEFNAKTAPEIDAITLSLDEIRSPAVLVDSKFNILWSRTDSPSGALSNIVDRITDPEYGNLIEVFLHTDIKHRLTCWKKLLRYFAFNAKTEISKDYLNHIYPDMSDNVIELLCTTISCDDDPFGRTLKSGISLPVIECSNCDFTMACHHCQEGSLYVFHLITDKDAEQLNHEDTATTSMDVAKASICGLCATLNNADKIEAQLLPVEYYQLLKKLWNTSLKIVKKNNGVFLSGNSKKMQCYFPETENKTEHIQNAIFCAFELKGNCDKIRADLKLKNNWSDYPRLNSGISLGADFLPSEKSPQGIVFSIPGGALDESDKISGIAGCGEIWASKNTIGSLEPDTIKTLNFGIKRGENFIRNTFSRISDLEALQTGHCDMKKIGSLSVTQVRSSTDH